MKHKGAFSDARRGGGAIFLRQYLIRSNVFSYECLVARGAAAARILPQKVRSMERSLRGVFLSSERREAEMTSFSLKRN